MLKSFGIMIRERKTNMKSLVVGNRRVECPFDNSRRQQIEFSATNSGLLADGATLKLKLFTK
jgi:hypothetical protein